VFRTAPFALSGAAGAVALALALSSRFPIGVGHLLELDRGFDVNLTLLSAGFGVALVFAASVSYWLGWRPPGRGEAPVRRAPGGLSRVLSRNGAPAEIVIGTHFAFGDEPGGGSSTRTAVAGGAAALAVVVGLGVFAAAVDHLYANGAARGWPWDAVVGNTNFTMSKARENNIVHDRRVAAATRARYGQATVGGRSAEVLAYDPAGDAPPEMLSGRLPTHADEIAPGEKLLRELHAHVGDHVELSVADSEFAPPGGQTTDRRLTVVGVSEPPIMGESEFGEVAVVALDAIRAAGGTTAPQLVLAKLSGNRVADARGLAHDYTPDVILDNVPARIVNLHRVRALPLLGALLAALFGTVLLTYTLAVAVRRRIRQLGVLRALGMSARRVSRVLVWQGVSLALAITIIGLPIGVMLGAAFWRAFAQSLGVGTHATFPNALLLLAPAAIVVGVLAAVVPARRARRRHVGTLLRPE
jgi:putative ABC transport system permease protein